jgi:hypothetical protein
MQIPTFGKRYPAQKLKPLTRLDQLHIFKRKAGCTLEESKFYMENANFDVEAALLEFKEDQAWSKEAEFKGSQATAPILAKTEKKESLLKKFILCN